VLGVGVRPGVRPGPADLPDPVLGGIPGAVPGLRAAHAGVRGPPRRKGRRGPLTLRARAGVASGWASPTASLPVRTGRGQSGPGLGCSNAPGAPSCRAGPDLLEGRPCGDLAEPGGRRRDLLTDSAATPAPPATSRGQAAGRRDNGGRARTLRDGLWVQLPDTLPASGSELNTGRTRCSFGSLRHSGDC